MNRVYIKTYGCQMNERDSDAVEAMLRARGYSFVDSEAEADVILINTCSVRDQAEQKALGKMGRMQRLKRKNPKLVLGIMGCMAQNRGAELLDRLPELDLVVGTQKLHRVPEHLEAILKTKEALGPQPEGLVDIAEEAGSQNEIRVHPENVGVSAFVSIQQGCDMDCAYCIVPKTRGDERSRPMAEIVEEIRGLAENGVKEVTLLGQIVTSWGRKAGVSVPEEKGGESCLDNFTSPSAGEPCSPRSGSSTSMPNDKGSEDFSREIPGGGGQLESVENITDNEMSRGGLGVSPFDAELKLACSGSSTRLPNDKGGAGFPREILGSGELLMSLENITADQKRLSFVDLLEAIERIDGIERVRFTSPHPRGFKEELINCYGRLKKLCEGVHLPLQSGSDKILRAMNRPYTAARYLQIVDALRARVPEIYLSTDVIVGFPGETDEDFEQTREVFKRVGYDMAFVFKYSPRTGTPATQLGDQVSEEVKEARNQLLLEILHESSRAHNEALIGSTQEVLVEGWAKRGGKLMGKNRAGRKILFEGGEELMGELVEVRIKSASVTVLEGEKK